MAALHGVDPTDIIKCLVELFDDCHLLVVKDDLVVIHDFEDSLCGQ